MKINGGWQHLLLGGVLTVLCYILAGMLDPATQFLMLTAAFAFCVELTQIETLRKIYWIDTIVDLVLTMFAPILFWWFWLK